MATVNPFDLLGDDDNDDPSHLIQVQQQKIAAKKLTPAAPPPAATAKLPSKPIPPSQAVREAKSITATARGGGGGRGGYGRGGRGSGIGPNRDFGDGNYNGFARGYGGGGGGGGGDGDGGRPPERERNHGAYGFRGGRRGEYGNGGDGVDSDRPSRRVFDRHSGSGHGNDVKREGSGRGNWGTVTDDVLAQETEENVNLDEKVVAPEKQLEQENGKTDVKANKESQTNEAEEKEQEDKEMTLEEYEKIREDKRKALLSLKTEERKVEVDKEFESMQQLSLKKGNDDVFIKLGSDKDNGKKRENAERDVVKKPVSINDFLKPAEGERYYSPGVRGRGRGRGGDRGSFRGGFGGRGGIVSSAPSIEDPTQFPSLGGK